MHKIGLGQKRHKNIERLIKDLHPVEMVLRGLWVVFRRPYRRPRENFPTAVPTADTSAAVPVLVLLCFFVCFYGEGGMGEGFVVLGWACRMALVATELTMWV